MMHYKLELRMADHTLKINKEIKEMIIECAKRASSSLTSKRNNRKFWINNEMLDDYTVIMNITSRSPINPTRTMSTITRHLTKEPAYLDLVKDHVVNGMIFQTRCIEEENDRIIQKPDDKIVSEIISLFFGHCESPKEKELRREYAEKIRIIILEFLNKKER